MDYLTLLLTDGNTHTIALHPGRMDFEFSTPVTIQRMSVVHQPEPEPEPPRPPESPDFLARVLEWLRSPDCGFCADAAEVLHVTGDGSDWEGDTEGGFYSSFGVEIEYLTEDGRKRSYRAAGSEAESLWEHVIRSWPA